MASELRKFMGFETEEEKQQNPCPSLSYKERMIGFGICFGVGILIQFFSMGSIIGIFVGNPGKFAVLFSFGNIFSILGTFFLMGPYAQYERMKDESRKYTSMVFAGSLVLTLISYYLLKSNLLTFIFLLIQFFSYIWYVLSYIPYGRDLVLNCIKNNFRS